MRAPARAFSNEDLPTFGRPTMATEGRVMWRHICPERRWICGIARTSPWTAIAAS
jgi:hypothetical protein